MADAGDLKSPAVRRMGSTPIVGNMIHNKVKDGSVGVDCNTFHDAVLLQCNNDNEQARVILTPKQAVEIAHKLLHYAMMMPTGEYKHLE